MTDQPIEKHTDAAPDAAPDSRAPRTAKKKRPEPAAQAAEFGVMVRTEPLKQAD